MIVNLCNRTMIQRLLFFCLLGYNATVGAAGMGLADARHLLARTGFGPTWPEIREFAALSRTEGVDRLLTASRVQAVTPPPAWVAVYPPPVALRDLSLQEQQRRQQVKREQGRELRVWWLTEMRDTPTPLTERMTLFWHNHFTSALPKVSSPVLMYRQNVLLRHHALGRFDVLLHEIAKDPAMLIYLDGAVNRKRRPNENFAREVMELFTLGEGYYREADVKDAARAFTGWSLDRETGEFCFRPAWHDGGTKTILGQTGRFDGDAVLDILLAQPETAVRVVRKLWREFISLQPDEAEVKRIAEDFRKQRYEIKAALRCLLNSPAFWAPAHRGVLVKSPLDFVIGLQRQLDLKTLEQNQIAQRAAQLGQNVFAPPNVKGWPGGEAWLDSRALLLRRQIVRQWSMARRPRKPLAQNLDFAIKPWIRQFEPVDWREAAQRLLLPLPPLRQPAAILSPIEIVQALLLDPVYQLK